MPNSFVIAKPPDLLDALVAVVPDFRATWIDKDNLYVRDDGSFTYHGVFLEFTSYFRDHHSALRQTQLEALAALLNWCFGNATADLDNAAATCFLENIAGEECAQRLSLLLHDGCREYMSHWGPDGT